MRAFDARADGAERVTDWESEGRAKGKAKGREGVDKRKRRGGREEQETATDRDRHMRPTERGTRPALLTSRRRPPPTIIEHTSKRRRPLSASYSVSSSSSAQGNDTAPSSE